jgi:hypothetical protein
LIYKNKFGGKGWQGDALFATLPDGKGTLCLPPCRQVMVVGVIIMTECKPNLALTGVLVYIPGGKSRRWIKL